MLTKGLPPSARLLEALREDRDASR
jgi:hypothetical protein